MRDCDWIIIGAIAGGLLTWMGQRSMQGVLKQQASHLTRALDVLELYAAGDVSDDDDDDEFDENDGENWKRGNHRYN